MKAISYICSIVILSGFIISCASKIYPTIPIEETWMQQVQSDPRPWVRGSSSWFQRGDLSLTNKIARMVPFEAALSNMTIDVPNFDTIKVSGDFQVELFGAYKQNSVYVVGPNELIRNVGFKVQGRTIVIQQLVQRPDMHNVVIRIGVGELRRLVQEGNGIIEGIELRSRDLTILTAGAGNIYLSGELLLTHISKTGLGSVTVMGANSDCLDIESAGLGNINLFGSIGLRSIADHGCGNINIIGAYSPELKVYADGSGKIGIVPGVEKRGIALVEAGIKNGARLYVCGINSKRLVIFGYDHASIGLSGSVNNLYVNTYDQACFQGRNLCAVSAYIKARNYSHANVASGVKVFADAEKESSIYYFGPRSLLSGFTSGLGMITPFYIEGTGTCLAPASKMG